MAENSVDFETLLRSNFQANQLQMLSTVMGQMQPNVSHQNLQQQQLIALLQQIVARGQSQLMNIPEPLPSSPQAPRPVKVAKRKSIVKENEPPMGFVHLASVKQEPDQKLGALKLNTNLDHHVDHQTQPLSSSTSVDEGVHTSSTSPTETHSGPVSPDVDEEHELPKESEQAGRKRPAAIYDMLKKRQRLGGLVDELMKDRAIPEEEGEVCRPNSMPNSVPSMNWNSMNALFEQKAAREDDAETASSTSSKHEERHVKSEETDNNLDLLATLFNKNANNQTVDESQMSEKNVDFFGQDFPSNWDLSSNEVYESPEAKNVPHDQIFAQVPGRLSLLSNVVKYKMTVGEIRRRVRGPEAFNFSLLGALLRRAKMPEKSQALLGELNAIGLKIPRGRRRAEKVTLLSALTEAEAEQMVIDFDKVSEQHFPCQEFVEYAHQNKPQPSLEQMQVRIMELNATRRLVNEFVALLQMDRSEVRDQKPEPILPANIQDPLSTYSMLTHGFGTAALIVGVNMLGSFVDKQMDLLKKDLSQMAALGLPRSSH